MAIPKVTNVTIEPSIIKKGTVKSLLRLKSCTPINPAIAGTRGRQHVRAVIPDRRPRNIVIGYVRNVIFSKYEANLVIVSNINILLLYSNNALFY
jgi:hypothetical protein